MTIAKDTVDFGDVNQDGKINVLDLVGMKEISSGTADYVKEADVNNDNVCTAADITLLMKYLLGVISKFN